MKISEKTFSKVFNVFLLVIAITIIFRKPCTVFLIVFAVFNLVFLRKRGDLKNHLGLISVIASPFLLELLLFFNNDSYFLGLKSLEKSLSLLFLPLIIIANYKYIQFNTILKYYCRVTTAIILVFFIRFMVFYPELFMKYLRGNDLWEMGYVFSDSIGVHAPALNMHLAFVAFSNFNFLLNSANKSTNWSSKVLEAILFALSFFFVLYVNTRIALLASLFGFVIVAYFSISKSTNTKVILKRVLVALLIFSSISFLFVQKNPYMIKKYSSQIFSNMDKIGKLDEIEHPEITVYSSFVTRMSIWKSAFELSLENLPFGVGASDSKTELVKYFKKTNQVFLAKYEFPTHNQFLDYLLKFGVLGLIVSVLYIGFIGFLGGKTKNPVITSFFFLFLASNTTDDFLIRFDGIVFSGLWISIFTSYRLQQKNKVFVEFRN